MSVYAVTTDQRCIRYDLPVAANGTIWLQDKGDSWLVYYKTCDCRACSDEAHKSWIASVRKSTIVSIGFYRPIAVEGRMLTSDERRNITDIADWLDKAKNKRRCPNSLSSTALRNVVR